MSTSAAANVERGVVHRASLPPLAYIRLNGAKQPGIFYLGGYLSTKEGVKVTRLMQHYAHSGHSIVAFDYTDKGESVHPPGSESAAGYQPQWSFDQWLEDARTAFDRLAAAGPHIVVGSSMGAWLGALLARENVGRIAGLVTVACAVDFTRHMADHVPVEQQAAYDNGDVVRVPGGLLGTWPVSKRLVAESSNVAYRVLASHSPQLPITAPCRLLHAVDDQLVPYDLSVRLMRKLQSDDVTLTLCKDADHAMSDTASVQLLIARIDELLALCASKCVM